jgi:hypothetical protein
MTTLVKDRESEDSKVIDISGHVRKSLPDHEVLNSLHLHLSHSAFVADLPGTNIQCTPCARAGFAQAGLREGFRGCIDPVLVSVGDFCDSLRESFLQQGMIAKKKGYRTSPHPMPTRLGEFGSMIPFSWQLCPKNMIFDITIPRTGEEKIFNLLKEGDRVIIYSEAFLYRGEENFFMMKKGKGASDITISCIAADSLLERDDRLVFCRKRGM